MKLLESDRLQLPKVFFITNRKEIKDIPIGVPYIVGDAEIESSLVRILEYEVLYQQALASGFPFNFKKLLKDAGFNDLNYFSFEHPVYMEFNEECEEFEDDYDFEEYELSELEGRSLSKFIKDSAAYVDIAKLKELNVFPIWLDTIEKAISVNINNFAVFDYNLYNKKLDGMYGDFVLSAPKRNLIIIDISGSIPRAVSSTCLTMSKNLAESFYADILITGSKSTLYTYEELHTLNVESIYEENGMDNDQTYFKNLLTSDNRHYETVICFGDNHSPCDRWNNPYNKGTKVISRKQGQKMCKWQVNKIISFHTNEHDRLAGYADWFTCDEVEHIENWVKYL